ncbi:hypothetical protein Q9L42_005350 [Methylomarinum sp. Ch1-1]|uniref:Uncharacterized protein n=1 Tax=Methylomarinum roseum TaxID=3067653 RepID=A0AAU7NX42_9GAMM
MSPEELVIQAHKEHFESNNLIEAEQLYLQAANMGSGHAAHELGVLYIVPDRKLIIPKIINGI